MAYKTHVRRDWQLMLSPMDKQRVLALCGTLSTPGRCGIPGITEVTRGRWCVKCLKSLAKEVNDFVATYKTNYTDVTPGILFYYKVVASEVARNLGTSLSDEVSPLWDKYSTTLNNRKYIIWSTMIDRCYDPTHPDYSMWGGRGATVNARWLNFTNFVDDVPYNVRGVYLKPGFTEFSPDNCHWKC